VRRGGQLLPGAVKEREKTMRELPAKLSGRLIFSCAALGAALLVAAPVCAADPGYVGTWTTDLAQCKTPQDQQGAPLVVAKDRYDQHEAHCEFKSVEGADPDWKIKADCTVEGSAEPHEFTFTASGDTLTQTDAAGSRDLLKCP
jgi:hypothetical protein